VLPDSLDMVRRLLSETEQQRAGSIETLTAERKSERARIQQNRLKSKSCEQEALGCKRKRRELEELMPVRKAEHAKCQEVVTDARVKFAEMQAHLDQENARHFRQLPIAQVKESDSDLQEERRKLRIHKPAKRAIALSDGVTSFRQQEMESHELNKERVAAADKIEQEVRKLRQQQQALKNEVEKHREQAACAAENAAAALPRSQSSGEMLSQDDGSVSLKQIKQEVLTGATGSRNADPSLKGASPSTQLVSAVMGAPQERKKRSVTAGSGSGAAAEKERQAQARAAAAQREAEDEDQLFGGPARKALRGRPGASLLSSKPALLGKAHRASPAAVHIVSSVVTPSRQMR